MLTQSSLKPTSLTKNYLLNCTYCEGTPYCEVILTRSRIIFVLPLYAKTHRPILVPIECLQWKYRSSTTSCCCSLNATLSCTPEHWPPVLYETRCFWNFSGILTIGPLTSNSNSGNRPQSYHIALTDPQFHRLIVL